MIKPKIKPSIERKIVDKQKVLSNRTIEKTSIWF